MSDFNKIRIVKNGKTLEERDYTKGDNQPAVDRVSIPTPSNPPVVTDVRSQNIIRLSRMFGLGDYGHNLAREIVEEIWQDGFYHGIDN